MQQHEDKPQDEQQQPQLLASGANAAAMRALIATLGNNPQMSAMAADQAATLTRLRRISAAIEALNQSSAQKYATLAPLLLRAVRLASRVNADLNEVSSRIRSVRTMMEELRELQQQSEQHAH
ncbi:hypothetical protein BWQ96_03320 [Gracilariopsis chorda]|uniref:KxDL domain-containing protein n=1 Tax=Gracilariopsis chorda TaxID=448386 RepID=A0A2V3IXV9_9FLOR|nr:hypothetical protein BWQ96_03320 [Gracilariopsis chorda]|eukprot:PXF46982.1 hypothetical protein BWQ96_03320 [Gracilariopsis chorda]